MTEESSLAIKQPTLVRVMAKIFSYVFHPLFLPTYIFIWLTLRFPYEFVGFNPVDLFLRKITVFWMTAFFPAFGTFLCWRVGFIDSIYLRTQKERIIPYVITMFFYWWMWYLSLRVFNGENSEGQLPEVLKFFYLGIGFASVFGLILNNFFKISMHAMGVGGALMFVILTGFFYHLYIGLDISLALLVAGVVCTSRLLLNEHGNKEIYAGIIVGIICQLLAYWLSM
ncbi:MAG TPA: hypothetical protein VG738_21545 [Chitinophagaceae bacterium]|nr:hypothetical protein [Chitinophagaceae bacterium]